MKYLDPADQLFLPVIVAVRGDTLQLLSSMADEMEISLDELFSALAEDSVTGLAKADSTFGETFIPNSCSTEDLLKSLQ